PIARLLELYALERDVPLYGYGSTTFRLEPKSVGLEPDECYVVGGRLRRAGPDLAIEVVITSGGVSKLEVYRRLGVREVWFWQKGSFHLYQLGRKGYDPVTTSAIIPDLDFGLLARFARRVDQPRA